MSLEGLVLDSLDIDDGTNYRIVDSLEIGPPSKRLLWIAGREGDILGDVPGYERRTVTFKVMITGATMDTALTALGALTDKLQKAERTNGGISLVWTPSGSSYSKTIKVLAGEIDGLPLTPDAQYFRRRPTVTVRLDCKPFLYGSETSYATVTSSAPHVVAMARSVAGDVPAEGRLILTDMATQERDFAEYGLDPDPVTMEDLALDYSPSLFLRLGSSSGLTDQSGNGYNGTAQGGVTVGGATSLLTGDDSTATDFDGFNDYISTSYTTRRNLITNPSMEVNTTGWSGHNGTLTRDNAAGAQIGSWALKVTPTGTPTQLGAIIPVAFATSSTYSLRVAVWVGGGDAGTITVTLTDATGIGGGNTQTKVVTAGTWTYFTLDGATTGGSAGTNAYVYLTQSGGATFDEPIYMDAFVLEKAATVGGYFDGTGYEATAGTPSTFVSDPGGKVGWLGTAHASASDKGCFANGTVRTFAGVVYLDSANSNKLIFSNQTGARSQAIIGAGPNLQWSADGAEYDTVIATLSSGTPHHIAIVFDEPNNLVTGYLDGAVGSAATHNAQYGAGDSFSITNGAAPFDGKMQGVKVYERGLTADEIRQLYVAAMSPYLFDSAQLSTTGLAATGSTRTGAYNPTSAASSVLRVTTQTNWVGSCETGAIPHHGPFRAKARIWTDATDAQIRVAYKSGDAPFKRLNPIVLASGLASQWQEVDLGMLDIPQAQLGTQRTIVRIEVKSATSNKTFDVDYLELIPAARYGKARAPIQIATPPVFSAASGFDTESGAITGDALATGGNWTVVTNSDADDFSVTGGIATRAAVSDSGTGAQILTGRGVTAGTTTYAAIAAGLDFKFTSTAALAVQGLLARVVDSNNFVSVHATGGLGVHVVVGGSLTINMTAAASLVPDVFYTLRLSIDARGNLLGAIYNQGGTTPLATVSVNDSNLATGGTLASGKVGMADKQGGGTANTRTYDNFWAAVPETDAAIFSGKTGEFRCDDTLRQDSTGVIYGRPPVARGPGVFIPQAGSESKVARIVAKACRNDIEVGPRDNIADSTKLQVYATPRYLVTPR